MPRSSGRPPHHCERSEAISRHRRLGGTNCIAATLNAMTAKGQ
jgi:hypothetical protein